MKITNNSPASQGIQTIAGLVYVRAGQTRELDLTADQAERAGRIRGVVVEGKPVAAPKKAERGKRNADGDTIEVTALRRQFDASWERMRHAAGAAEGETLDAAIDRLIQNEASARSFEEKTRAALALEEGEGIIEGIAALMDRVAELELENEELKKQIPAPVAPEAKHRGAGSYSIMEGDTELREKLTKEQADAFNALDAEGKAKWLSDNPKAAA